jgi:hypothetical protein
MGAEDLGTPPQVLARCSTVLEIPSLSASINVACAFASTLAVMQLADRLK